jgi:DNA-directed RNA polymerase subunit RPC12/RpoP
VVLVECPNCKKKFEVDLLFSNGQKNCPNCSEKLFISGFKKKKVRMLNKKGFFEKIFRKRDQK